MVREKKIDTFSPKLVLVMRIGNLSRYEKQRLNLPLTELLFKNS